MVVLAAGMGSRFGGPKQLVPIGPSGESILDYNAHDAAVAGFDRIVIVTRPELERDVAELVDRGVGRVVETQVALQTVPERHSKPRGTADAVAAAAPFVHGPFAVGNSDDLYGPSSFQILHDHIQEHPGIGAAVGFALEETVPEAGAVSRAFLHIDDAGHVHEVVEVHGIQRRVDGGWSPSEVPGVGLLTGDRPISMNLWGFPAGVMGALAEAVAVLMADADEGEIYLPREVSRLVAAGVLPMVVLTSSERWSGITNSADIGDAREHAAARWPSPLWGR